MKIVNLMENTDGGNGCLSEHGLSFYVETNKHKLVVDTGATDAFLKNAERLGIDLTEVDTLVLSHGHYDHSGGILSFAAINPSAKIYLQKTAGGAYYSIRENGPVYIGIDKRILELPQVEFVGSEKRPDEELFLFSGVTGKQFWPVGNYRLKEKSGETLLQDTFAHEQCLVVEAEGKRILMSGCAHNGILNILERYRDFYGEEPDAVISGFHMMKQEDYTTEELAVIKETAHRLGKMKTKFFTGHCTGMPAYEVMKEIMGDKLCYVHSGETVLSGESL